MAQNDAREALLEGWEQYFDPTIDKPSELSMTNPIHLMLIAFSEMYEHPFYQALFQQNKTASATLNSPYLQFLLDYSRIVDILNNPSKDEHMQTFSQLIQHIQDKPQIVLAAMSRALAYKINSPTLKKVFIAVINYPLTELYDIKAHMIDTFMSFRAIILKVSSIKLHAVSMQFKCLDCKSSFKQYFVNGSYSIPAKCRGKNGCSSKMFNPDKYTLKTLFSQKLRVQQHDCQGRAPRIVNIQLRQNLVGKVIAGETIIVTGTLKTECGDQKDKKTQGIFTPILLANSIKLEKHNYSKREQDEAILSRMCNDKNIFINLIRSFCPAIYGHELIKAGMLLGMVGGSSKNTLNKTNFRQNSHILLLGDPGLGKSQMLKFAANVLPHSLYISGNAISTSGLTVTVNRQGGSEAGLEAGALVLCDGGVCAIDQFDKLTDSFALLQVMQQQTVSIAKSGIVCQLQSRVSIIGSANPLNGNYVKQKALKDNIKISNAILSRFDLIFLMLDNPDPERDKKLSQHIMRVSLSLSLIFFYLFVQIHNKQVKKISFEKVLSSQLFEDYQQKQFSSLAQKYSSMCHQTEEMYSIEEIKTYLSYVKSEVHPVLTPESAQILRCFYTTLRQQNLSSSFPITTRQLESLVRLAMARARLECRTQVTAEDAEEITQFMQQSLFDALQDMSVGINSIKGELKKNGALSKPPGQLSIPKQTKLFIQKLHELSDDRNSAVWEFHELMKVGKDLGLSVGDFDFFLQRLNNECLLLQKGGKRYELKYRKL